MRMRNIRPVQSVRITKDRRGLLEWHLMFLKVGNGLGDIPVEYVCVYTLIHIGMAIGGWLIGGDEACDCAAVVSSSAMRADSSLTARLDKHRLTNDPSKLACISL